MIHDAGRLGPGGRLPAGYALQIYFDFSGYSDMAIGLGRLFGIELPQNFNSPYQALNPSDFWRRWHMTLSSWLRDYLFAPLAGGGHSRRRRSLAILGTMFLGGLWHGANWTFAVWGIYHGLLIVGFHQIKKRWLLWPAFAQRGLTFLAVTLGWVFFRSPDFSGAARWLAALFGARGLGAGWTPELGPLLGLAAFGLALVQWTPNASGRADWEDLGVPAQAALGLTAAAAVLWANTGTKFLYFQF